MIRVGIRQSKILLAMNLEGRRLCELAQAADANGPQALSSIKALMEAGLARKVGRGLYALGTGHEVDAQLDKAWRAVHGAD